MLLLPLSRLIWRWCLIFPMCRLRSMKILAASAYTSCLELGGMAGAIVAGFLGDRMVAQRNAQNTNEVSSICPPPRLMRSRSTLSSRLPLAPFRIKVQCLPRFCLPRVCVSHVFVSHVFVLHVRLRRRFSVGRVLFLSLAV